MAQVLFVSGATQRIHIYSDVFTSRRTPIFHFTTNNTKAGFMILCWLVPLLVLWMPTVWELIYSSEEDLSRRLSSHRYLTRWMHCALPGCVGCFRTPKVIGFMFIYSLCYRPSWLWLFEHFVKMCCITFINHYWEMGIILHFLIRVCCLHLQEIQQWKNVNELNRPSCSVAFPAVWMWSILWPPHHPLTTTTSPQRSVNYQLDDYQIKKKKTWKCNNHWGMFTSPNCTTMYTKYPGYVAIMTCPKIL